MYALYEQLAHRYDLHTPPGHYRHDHAFVIEMAREQNAHPRLLDVGCGTGVLLEAARAAGVDAVGIDAAAGMVAVAMAKLGPEVVEQRRMQELEASGAFDVVVALSWTINYCTSAEEVEEVMRRCHRALRSGGRLIAQIAHAPNATGELFEDREPGPDGAPDDVVFTYRFTRGLGEPPTLHADYVYACRSANELASEAHVLAVADAAAVARIANAVGFVDVGVFDTHRRDPLRLSVSPWLIAKKPRS